MAETSSPPRVLPARWWVCAKGEGKDGAPWWRPARRWLSGCLQSPRRDARVVGLAECAGVVGVHGALQGQIRQASRPYKRNGALTGPCGVCTVSSIVQRRFQTLYNLASTRTRQGGAARGRSARWVRKGARGRLFARDQRELVAAVTGGLANERGRYLYQCLCPYSSRRRNGQGLGRSGRIWRQSGNEIRGQLPETECIRELHA